MAGHADIVVFVNVLSEDTAAIGVAYDRKVPHERVREDLGRLLQETGWGVARSLQISDASVHPDRLDRYPVTTAALISFVHAPQVVRGAPELRPYLIAFQRFNHVEVNFILAELTPYLGVQSVDNKSLAVELFHTQQGVYRFEALIRNHSGTLPTLAQAAPPPSVPTGSPSAAPQSGRFNPWSVVLILAGAGLITCACIYPFWLRRLPARMSPRPVVRR